MRIFKKSLELSFNFDLGFLDSGIKKSNIQLN